MSGLYIHIPFCHSKCVYCDFYSTPDRTFANEYVAAVISEWHERQEELRTPVQTVYIGGGTPSILSDGQITRIMNEIPTDVAELTMELNPEDVTLRRLEFLRRLGVNRLSMGVQSFNDSELIQLGRRHDAATAAAAATMLKEVVGNVSLDIMFGIPGQTVMSWNHTLDAILRLRPAHISAYSLMLEPGTRLYRRVRRGEADIPSQEANGEMYHILCRRLADEGYVHYEISNFALPGFKSHHNSNYWNHTEYLGLGASSHSFDGVDTRTANTAKLRDYLTQRNETVAVDKLSVMDKIEESIMLSLRCSSGLETDVFEKRYGSEAFERLKYKATPLIERGYLDTDGRRWVIPEEHWLIADSIVVTLFPD